MKWGGNNNNSNNNTEKHFLKMENQCPIPKFPKADFHFTKP